MKRKREKTSEYRKLSIYGFQMVDGAHTFCALLEFDVTDLRKELRRRRIEGTGGSLFAFLLKAIGRCLEEYPQFNAMIDSRNHTTFDEVDIDIPIEILRNGEIFNRQHIIRNINAKTVRDVDEEIEAAKNANGEELTYMRSGFGRKLMTMLPGNFVLFFLRRVLKNHDLVRRYSGTVFVTSVSMFSNAPGFIIPYSGGPKAVSFAIGSVVKKPVVRNDEIVIREMLNVTSIFNHDLVDGAPAARFINRLRRYVEDSYDGIFSGDEKRTS